VTSSLTHAQLDIKCLAHPTSVNDHSPTDVKHWQMVSLVY